MNKDLIYDCSRVENKMLLKKKNFRLTYTIMVKPHHSVIPIFTDKISVF